MTATMDAAALEALTASYYKKVMNSIHFSSTVIVVIQPIFKSRIIMDH